MENEMIRKIKDAEILAKEMEDSAKKAKESTIDDAHLAVEKMELEHEVYKKNAKQRIDANTKEKNDEAMKIALSESKAETQNLIQKVKNEKTSAIALVMSLIS